MYLIVGLGNPESDYSQTRHNMGFNVINKLADKYGIEVNKSKFKALYGKGKIKDEQVVLIKPQTYMNLSGEAVQESLYAGETQRRRELGRSKNRRELPVCVQRLCWRAYLTGGQRRQADHYAALRGIRGG